MTAATSIQAIWKLAFAPPDRRPIYEWAAENVTIPPTLTRRGLFSIEHSRHFIGPLDAIQSPRVREVNILKPVRGGGTLIADISVPWAILHDHASILWVFPVNAIAKNHAETREWPILESVPAIAAMLPTGKQRHKKRTQDIIFNNGLPLTLQGTAISGLQSRGFKWVICDEPWLYETDTISQAKARLGDYAKLSADKFIAISQGGEEQSYWDLQASSGSRLEWHVKCQNPACARHFIPKWTDKRRGHGFPDDAPATSTNRAGVMFDTIKNPDGTYDIDASANTARYICAHCGHEHPDTEATRAAWDATGEYRHADGTPLPRDPRDPSRIEYPERCTFHWWAIVDTRMSALVKHWLAAQNAKRVGILQPLVDFCQKYLAEMRSEYSAADNQLHYARKKISLLNPADKAWPDEEIRFLTADRQKENTYWVLIRGWSSTGESRRLWFGRCYSEADIESKRIEYNVDPTCTIVDSGNWAKGPNGVYATCIRYEWVAAKGEDVESFTHITRLPNGTTERVLKPFSPTKNGDPGAGTAEEGNHTCPLILFSSPVCKDTVMALIESEKWVEPEVEVIDDMEKEYRAQMIGEYKRPERNRKTGRVEPHWYCPNGNNHALDCAAMQVLCAMTTGMIPIGLLDETHSASTTVPASQDTTESPATPA